MKGGANIKMLSHLINAMKWRYYYTNHGGWIESSRTTSVYDVISYQDWLAYLENFNSHFDCVLPCVKDIKQKYPNIVSSTLDEIPEMTLQPFEYVDSTQRSIKEFMVRRRISK
jgi:hypothetical protein